MYGNDVIGTTIPAVWLNGGAHYRQMKGWFTPTLSTLVLRQCLIMGSSSDHCTHYVCGWVFLSLFVSVTPSLCPWVDVMLVRFFFFPVELYTSRNLTGPLLCLCCTPPVRHHRVGTGKVERGREGEHAVRWSVVSSGTKSENGCFSSSLTSPPSLTVNANQLLMFRHLKITLQNLCTQTHHLYIKVSSVRAHYN